MGLREDALAARIAADEKLVRDNAERERQRIERLEARRAKDVEQAERDAKLIGFEFVEHAWVPIFPQDRIHPALLVRTDDGVWLQWVQASVILGLDRPRGGFWVVDKCPTCDMWVQRGGTYGAANTLAGIGRMLEFGTRSLEKHHENEHGGPLPPVAPPFQFPLTVLVHAVAWRHKEPGEGAGGCEWDLQPGLAKERVAGILTNDDVEWNERSFLISGFRSLDRDAKDRITDAIDTHFWSDFYGEYPAPVLLEGWDS